MNQQHRFGGDWTAAKLSALSEYLLAYTTALKAQPFKLHYVDAFAGSGSFVPKSGSVEQSGSARLALGVEGFARYHFIERSPRRCNRLRQVVESEGMQTKATIIHGEANEYLAKLCRETDWRNSRAVVFLDPYGMQVEWATLEALAKTGAIDVWYLFPLSGVTRQLALDEANLDESKRRSLERVFGTTDWRQAFYEEGRNGDLFGAPVAIGRHADSGVIERWVTARLKSIFPVVVGPEILRRGHAGRAHGGPRLFALYFLASTPRPKGQSLARRIASGVLNKLRRDQA